MNKSRVAQRESAKAKAVLAAPMTRAKRAPFTLAPICFATLFMCQSAWALNLVDAFNAAKNFDPKYQAAKSEKTANNAQGIRDTTAYAPVLGFTQQQFPTYTQAYKSQQINQPLFDAAKGASVAQGSSRFKFADANFEAQTQDLAIRLLNVVNQIALAKEAIAANQSQIDALESQYAGAKRKYELGQGTVTDMLDVQVKFEQAKANDYTLKAGLKAAGDQFQAITGDYAAPTDFTLPNQHDTSFRIGMIDEILTKVEKENPNILAAKANERIAQLDIAKASGAVLPTVSYTWQKTFFNGVMSNNNGVTINLPLDVGAYVGTYATYAKARQSMDQREQVESQSKVDAKRYYDLIVAGQQSLKIKGLAVNIAKQSVTANQKSYDAGVKTTVDVLFAIQTLFQTRNDYAQGATSLASNLLNLLLVGAENSDDAMAQTQAFLFRK